MARVEEMTRRADELAAEMNKPEVASNGAMMVRLAREHGELEKIARLYRDYRGLMREIEESQQIVDEPGSDDDLRQLAEEQMPGLLARRERLLTQMQERLVTGNEASIRSIILEVRAGTGGEEAALFARELLDMYLAYAARKGFKTEVMSLSDSDLGGVKEAIVNITGEEVYMHYRFEAGGHRVQRVPKTEAQGRIHTSAATVAVLPEPEEVEVDIDWEKEVIEYVSRAGGPGGQGRRPGPPRRRPVTPQLPAARSLRVIPSRTCALRERGGVSTRPRRPCGAPRYASRATTRSTIAAASSTSSSSRPR
jgi:peptide chain release factor 1